MKQIEYDQLISDIKIALANDARTSFAIIGHTPVTYDIVAFFRAVGAEGRLLGAYSQSGGTDCPESWHKPLSVLRSDRPDVAIIASDPEKERLLAEVEPYLTPTTRILFGGYAHFTFRDPVFDEVVNSALVPSLANGYPNILIHLYQCLWNAARLGLKGVVAEFGMFKGGTTLLLSRFIERLGQRWPVIGFDTFAGFPARRSVLDMYDYPDCVCCDIDAIRQHLAGRNIEIVTGDVVLTASRLESEDIVLAFIDTDNFTSAAAALAVTRNALSSGAPLRSIILLAAIGSATRKESVLPPNVYSRTNVTSTCTARACF